MNNAVRFAGHCRHITSVTEIDRAGGIMYSGSVHQCLCMLGQRHSWPACHGCLVLTAMALLVI